MKKALIVFATREGQTEKVALRIANHLSKIDFEVDVQNAADAPQKPLGAYDLILCGGSMHIGGIEKELTKFVNSNAKMIEQKPNSFFLVLLSAATKNPKLRAEWLSEAEKRLREQIQLKFDHVEMIAGALKYSKYPWPVKWIMRRIAKKAGEGTDFSKDYEYTDWDQVKKYAENLAKR